MNVEGIGSRIDHAEDRRAHDFPLPWTKAAKKVYPAPRLLPMKDRSISVSSARCIECVHQLQQRPCAISVGAPGIRINHGLELLSGT